MARPRTRPDYRATAVNDWLDVLVPDFEMGAIFDLKGKRVGTVTRCNHRDVADATRGYYREITKTVGNIQYRVLEHILIWAMANKRWPETSLDHIDQNSLNNRLDNLRLADQRQNLGNTPRPRHNKTGVKNVSYSPSNYPSPYRTIVRSGGKDYTASASTLHEAEEQAWGLQRKVFGEFATAPEARGQMCPHLARRIEADAAAYKRGDGPPEYLQRLARRAKYRAERRGQSA